MLNYIPYTHIRRLDTDDCIGLLNRTVEITAKVDGTNGLVWKDGDEYCCGSRRRKLGPGANDNAGFWAFCQSDDPEAHNLRRLLNDHPDFMVYGEWMGNPSFVGNIKAYDRAALGHFYIFDVYQEGVGYLPPSWRNILAEYGLEPYFVQVLAILDHPSEEAVKALAEQNHFLLPPDVIGEGVVIKAVKMDEDGAYLPYAFTDRNGDFIYGKYVRERYKKDKSVKKIDPNDTIQSIVDFFVPVSEVEKAMAKVALLMGKEKFDSTDKAMVGRLFNMVFVDSICDECYNIVKKFKYPVIDFKSLKKACDGKVREVVYG